MSETPRKLRAAPLDSRVLEDAETEMVVADVRTHIGEQDARRLAAAWNATRDIPVEALEAGRLGEALELARKVAWDIGEPWDCVVMLQAALRALGVLGK